MTTFNTIIANITTIKADAIVNSANTSLQKGSGLCKAIYEKAGDKKLDNYLAHQENLKPGAAIVTPGFKLPAQYIIHTVTPKFFLQNPHKVQDFASCYVSILQAANYYNCQSIAIPCLGVGHHGWPLQEAAKIAVSTIKWYLEKHESCLKSITFVCYNDAQVEAFKKQLAEVAA